MVESSSSTWPTRGKSCHVSLQSCSKQQPSGETFDEYSLPVVDNPNGGANSSLEQSLDYSYDLLTSTADESEVGVMSARVIKWRGTVKRKTKKPRRAEISDVDSQLEEDTACKRNHGSCDLFVLSWLLHSCDLFPCVLVRDDLKTLMCYTT